jgi:hypothetical protein
MLKKLIKHKLTKDIVLVMIACVSVIYFSGKLGAGDFLSNHFAFGYGGGMGGILLPPITAVNQPLYLCLPGREGKLYKSMTNNMLVEMEVPPLAVPSCTIFDISEMEVNDSNQLCDTNSYIVGNRVFDFTAKNLNQKKINTFAQNINIYVSVPNLPSDLSNLGIYFLNSNNQWVFGQSAVFDNNNKTVFQVNSLGTFAIINANGLPRVIETKKRCQLGPLVLGYKEYSDGSLLRTCDLQTYVIEKGLARQIALVPAPKMYYQEKPIYDVDYEVLYQYQDASQREKYVRQYKDGELLRGCDWRIFRVEGQRGRYINTLEEIRSKWEGQVINNVDYWVLARYLPAKASSIGTEVLGIKEYADGTLIRTPDGKVYIIENKKAIFLTLLSLSETTYNGKKVYDVTADTIYSYQDLPTSNEQKVLGYKVYGEGTLLRTRDFKIYIIENGKAKQIASWPGTGNTYEGKKFYEVDYGTLAQYQEKKESIPGAVLGVKKYSDGTLVRTPDKKIFIIENGKPRHIATLAELKLYGQQKFYEISLDELTQYSAGQVVDEGPQVLGIKKYADGTILKTPDWRVYIIENGGLRYLDTIASTQVYYQGKNIYNVGYDVIALYGNK